MVRIGKKRFQTLFPMVLIQFLFLFSFQFLGIPFVYGLIVLTFMSVVWWQDHRQLTDETKTDLGMMIIAIVMFTLFLYLSPFYLENHRWINRLVTALTFPAFYLAGYWLIHIKQFSFKTIFKVLIIGLSFFVLLNVLYTLFRYLPWYRALYAGQVIYVNGEVYVVSEEVKWLIGLQFVEVYASQMDFYLTLLILPLVAHLEKFKTELHLQEDRWWLGSGFVALIGILLLPTFLPLMLGVLFALIFYGLDHLPRWIKLKPQLFKTFIYIDLSVLGLLIIVFFIDAYNLFNLTPVFKTIFPLNRILDFPLIEGYQSVLRSLAQYPFGGFAPIMVNGRYVLSTQSIVFDTLHQAGIFAFFGLVLIAVFFGNQLRVFYRQGQGEKTLRKTLVMMVVMFMMYQAFQTQLYPYVRESLRSTPRLLHEEPLWQMMFLMMGMIMIDPFTGMMKKAKSVVKQTAKKIK